MADSAAAPAGDAQVTFKVKTGGDKTHTLTMAETATVLELKNTLAGDDYEGVPAERQRLIYSGRVMKNDDPLSTYKIKPNNTIHMVKSAASNPTPQPSGAASTPTPAAVPQNMAAGVANNPLAGLTGARYAGHINLPSRDMFGADGGMGAPPSDDQMAQMLSDPAMMQTMNAALDNPQFIDYMIQSNPQLRNMPNARDIIQSPFMRQMMTNPDMLRNVMRMQRSMMGGHGAGAFPAPGATDNNPDAAAANPDPTANPATGAPNPFGFPPGGAGDMNQLMAQMGGLNSLFGGQGFPSVAPAAPGAPGETRDAAAAGTPGTGASQSPPPANPFAALFPPPAGGAQAGAGAGANPFMNPEAMQQMMAMLGGGAGASPATPPDNRPPEERYAEQLRQLNDMGFFDFDRNVAALRRSGGSVQGAIEHLLNGA